jgi:vancomycin resistance protein YoaR
LQHDPALDAIGTLHLSQPAELTKATAQRSSASRPRLERIVSRLVLALAVVLLASVGSLYWFRSTYQDRIYPAVRIAEMPVGDMSFTEARAVVAGRAEQFESATATFSYQGRTWTPTLRELGVHIDIEGTLSAAFGIGREGNARQRLATAWSLLRNDRSLPLLVRLDAGELNAWLDRVDADLGVTPKDATLVVEDGIARIEPEKDGLIVDRAQLTEQIMTTLRTLSPPRVALPVITKQPRIHAVDLENAKQKLDRALSRPITLTYEDRRWTLDPADLGTFVVTTVEDNPGAAPTVDVSLDQKALAKWLSQQLRSEIDRDPVDAVVAWNGKRVFAVRDSQDGAKLKPQTLAEAVITSFFGNHETVRIPVAVIEPRIDSSNLDSLGITTRLAVGTSNFDGSNEGRAENIRVGAEKLNGTLVAPGETFSFNHAIGVISEENGFVEAPVIDGERIGRDVGGGICQVSTTVFRAALFAGMPIEEWWPHRYRLGFYELDGWTPGLDASILQPEGDPFGGGDFIFRNVTDGWLLIEAYTDGPRVVVIIYGPDTGWKVDVSDPIYGQEYEPTEDLEIVDDKLDPGTIMQTEYAQKGLDVTYYRDVYDRDGNLLRHDEFTTHFYPRGNVWKVSPDMRGQSPAAKAGA